MWLRVVLLGCSWVLVAACSGSSGNPRSSGGTGSAAEAGSPAVGTCWQVPPAQAADRHYWHDDSPVVPCTKPHTTETAFVYPLARATSDAAAEVGRRCSDYVTGYAGLSDETWIPCPPSSSFPARSRSKPVRRGCAATFFFPADTAESTPRETSFPGHDAARRPPVGLWACLDRIPQRHHSAPYVRCEAPHRFEATGNIIHAPPTSRYPTPRVRDHAARQCEGHLPGGDGLVATVMWAPALHGIDLLGACLFHRSDGRPLPPRS